MIVVSDTSPLNYLILIRLEHILPALFGQVAIPPAVLDEMTRAKAPAVVNRWASSPPLWLELRRPTSTMPDESLGQGESEAIALAQELNADFLLIDERRASKIATNLGRTVTGTMGVLYLAAEKGLLDFPAAIIALRQTNFRIPEKVVAELLKSASGQRPK